MDEGRKVMNWLIVLGLFWFVSVRAAEFLYPVGVQSDSTIAYLIYQKTPNHIELWEWDYSTKQAEQMLFSRFTPAGFRLLLGEQAFSFIDNGLLRVKSFCKRSPRTIEFDAPIYNVEIVHWLDDEHCYTSGKYKDNFGIFQIDYEGFVSPLCVKDDVDCMYPQKIGDSLFYIERDNQWNHRIIKMPYIVPPCSELFSQLQWHEKNRFGEEQVVCFGQRPIVFLQMLTEQEGFVIQHPQSVSKTDEQVGFRFYHIKKTALDWREELLFTFSVPSDLLFTGRASRLYESVLPILPRYYQGKVLFVNCQNSLYLSLFSYDMTTKKIETILDKGQQHYFTPIIDDKGLLLCGGTLKEGGEIVMESGELGGVRITMAERS